MSDDRARLEKILGYQFADMSLLELALTHRSCGSSNNERLEFLGDAIIGLVVSELLFRKFPSNDEGGLTRIRASLVKGETLAAVAVELGLGEYLKLGGGERKSGGHRRQSILADAVEAVIGAVYLDSDIATCRDCIHRWFGNRLDNVVAAQDKDAKTRLQEFLQGRGKKLPVYDVVSVSGDPHDQSFKVSCTVELLPGPVYAEASNRRTAEKLAARQALESLEEIRGK